jgi:hypothetical protein
MAIEAAGRAINTVPVAESRSISLKNAQGVTFYAYGANEVVTLKWQATAGGSATNLATITRYRQSTATNGSAGWTEQTQAAAATLTVPSGGCLEFYVDANDLPATANYVEVVKTTSALVVAVVTDLLVQRDPANLAALSA